MTNQHKKLKFTFNPAEGNQIICNQRLFIYFSTALLHEML